MSDHDRDREGETSEEEIARVAGDLVKFFDNLPRDATRAYAALVAIDRELGERVETASSIAKKEGMQ